MAFLTLNAVKSQLHIPLSDTSVDVELDTYIDAASETVERHTGQLVDSRQITEVVHGNGKPVLAMLHGPVTSVDSIATLDGSRTWDTSGMFYDGSLIYLGAARITGPVKVEYTAGLVDVPAAYTLAGMIIVQHQWETRRGSMPLVTGDLDDSLQIAGLGFAIPNRALELLGAPAAGVA